MNSLERRALMQKRKKARQRNTIIIFIFLCVSVIAIILMIFSDKIFTPSNPSDNINTNTNSDITKEPNKYYNPFFQPLDLAAEYYFIKEEEPITSEIKLIEDNSGIIDIEAKYSVVIDTDSKAVLYNKSGSAKCYPASTTKILTALVALENCGIDHIIEIGNEIEMIKENSTIAYLQKGNLLTLKMLTDALLLPSGNDAAYSIAVNVARHVNPNPKLTNDLAVDQFCKLMTNKAASIGAANTNFTVPDGFYDENHYTTAYDMGLIALEALNNPTIKEAVSKSRSRNIFITGEDVTWNNSNMLIQRGSPYYYQYASGIKTGTNDESGHCLLSYAEKGEKRLIAVVMNSTPSGRWDDTIKLFEYFFSASGYTAAELTSN